MFFNHEIKIKGFKVSSNVSDQPKSSIESIKGAKNRALNALTVDIKDESTQTSVDYTIGLEGGMEKIDDIYFQSGWMVVYNCKTKQFGIGTSARVEMSNKIVKALLNDGKELSDVVDNISGKNNIGTKEGYFGIVTNNALTRAEAYSHGIVMAFAKFVSDTKYWD